MGSDRGRTNMSGGVRQGGGGMVHLRILEICHHVAWETGSGPSVAMACRIFIEPYNLHRL